MNNLVYTAVLKFLEEKLELPNIEFKEHVKKLLNLIKGNRLSEQEIKKFDLGEVQRALNSKILILYFYGNPFENYTEICRGTTDEELFEGLIKYIKSENYGGNPEPILKKIKECKTIDEFLKKQEDGDYFFDVI